MRSRTPLGPRSVLPVGLTALIVLGVVAVCPAPAAEDQRFADQVLPLLEDYCHTCHGNGIKKGGVDLDALDADEARRGDPKFWLAVLKNVRAGIMPPADEPQPTAEERQALVDWIKAVPFAIDPADPDPGRVTVRRLNRVEYSNTIRDLIGVEYDTTAEFPPDDTGYGFDNIGDVLTISPLLLEKYLAAAKEIVARAVPTVGRTVPETTLAGRRFRREGAEGDGGGEDRRGRGRDALSLSYYEPATATAEFRAEHDGHYQLVVELTATERFVDNAFDKNKCKLVFKADGQELLSREFTRQEGRPSRFEIDCDWEAGPHELAFVVEPLTPDEEQVRSLALRIQGVKVRGPLDDQAHWVLPADYRRFFPRDVPDDPSARREYARELLDRFATRAFRRPADPETVDRLVGLAEGRDSWAGQTFEAGVARGMTAVLTSPRFLFREEGIEPGSTDRYPLVDEYALASRLSYFLWSTMPDDELTRLADEHRLRAELPSQVERMLADPRSGEFFRHFVGQWLQARDVESVPINGFAVVARDAAPDPEADRMRARFRELNRKDDDELSAAEQDELKALRANFRALRSSRRFRDADLTGDLRRAMRRETEMLFEHVVRDDRSLLDLLDGDYTFLNERLAQHYGIEGVSGDEMRRVDLPADSPRGGILTQGTVLVVTSNPDRTSPVKRGLFLLDNVLGAPPAPPPPDIPPLEEAGKKFGDRVPTLRETLELHRSQPMCASCHSRMDPLGLALENFNAVGRWRDKERTDPIDPTGTLITGESFSDIRELKRTLVNDRRADFYRCLSEKLLTYALGRGLDHRDVQAVDALVDRIEGREGRASALVLGIVESTPFQRRRRPVEAPAPAPADPND